MGGLSHDVHIDKALSEFAIGYKPEGFIADAIFPVVTVGKQSDRYYEFSRADHLRRENTARAAGTEARKIVRNVSSGTYYAPNFALKYPVPIEDKINADPIVTAGLYDTAAEYIMDKLLIDWEVRVANQVTSGTNVGSYSAVSSAWNGAGDVIGDINAAIDNVQDSTGVRPNKIVMGNAAWRSARRDATVRNLINGTNNGGGFASRAAFANLFDMPESNLMIAGAYQNTGGEGLDESLEQIWNDNVLVYYTPERPELMRPAFAYSIRWSAPGLPNMQAERHPYNTRTKSEELEIGYYQDEKVTGAEYGFLLTACNSST